jgi:hypothetical protein
MNYDNAIYKSILASERTFDSEGRPYPIADDDLEEILSRSDFAPIKRMVRQ